ncbi:hypothetical protein AVEN_174124-1 [Araneus ventricosus]|uniref:DUF4371 domain-containing protein n=1 Tax=Araneus ventricosus TaxID=182803 RepID=A0A4Y2T2W5_ARAVE|nr:hypothetical protein AVEN_174124-1 [Araneus ventricosus]
MNDRATWIKNRVKVLKEVSKRAYYSIILDCTADLSYVEPITFVIRCITGEEPCTKEQFWGSISIEHSTGDALTDTFSRTGRDENSTEKYALPKL